ncbi:single-stranded-DNA-specific exonuclease RecJ [Ruminiclostridium cellobioparum]|uniref:Single-stranded-DNA-specific exonuclease RecJ n=1 Tax=Ruminiclostridium cellobioparum subsp. termitidis CT1112 TaxID=1195236 RepID=S0FZB9_RUMCE|nr:single-stranded-DNA-specific exonuclease RecJ [Ruminiclostridium cellobioparum subsp. termitidis CT1112]
MEKWILKNPKNDFEKMSEALGVSPLLCRIMVNRGISDYDTARRFISSDIADLYDARGMKDLEKGVNIITDKIKKGCKIRIIGDYDVDGVVSTFILYRALARCGAEVDYAIPHRIFDGYGINNSIIDKAKEDNVDTIITCDNGIAATEQIKYAKAAGLTVVVTDHHEVPFVETENNERLHILPEADAVIDIKRADCGYPFKLLCGAGVAFKFVQVLYSEMEVPVNECDDFYEFVAIATVCDVVDLVGENRILVKKGLSVIGQTKNIGLKALMKQTGIFGKEIGVYHLGFIIGPCINASGRLDWAEKGLKMLLSDNDREAELLALELHNLNTERKDMTLAGVEETVATIEGSSLKQDKILVVYKPDIHESIAGIIAGKIREKYNVPTFIITDAESGVKGSGRSIEEYNMFEGLLKCKELLNRFGGHPMAAGLSLDREKLELLRKQLNETATLTEEDLIPKVYIDARILLSHINLRVAEELSLLEPYGKGNSKPLFAEKGITVTRAAVLGSGRKILKLRLLASPGKYIDAIYFGNICDFDNYISEKYGARELTSLYTGQTSLVKLDIIFNIDINEYNGYRNVQLVMQYYR